MQKVVLKNGLTILYYPKPSAAVVLQAMVKVGSNNETAAERGIAHFLEHILFEGTAKRPTNRAITNEIERIGGDFNAYTTGDRTCFHIKVLQKQFPIAVDVLADMLQNSLFKPADITKEKNVVLKEIDLVYDDPRFYQWVLFQKHLFIKHPSRYPTYGDKKVIHKLTREKIIHYFRCYYRPNNIVISVVGDVPGWRREIQRKFRGKPAPTPRLAPVREPVATKNQERREKKKVVNTYIVLGYKTVSRGHADSYVFDVINGILGRGQSGRLFTEIRAKKGLAYEVGSQQAAELTAGYFAAYASIDRKNVALVKKLILEELDKIKNVPAEEVQEAKEFVEGDYLLDIEELPKLADQLLFWEQVKDAQLVKEYVHRIRKVTVADVQRVARTYFKNHACVVLEGK
ncbi:MAG: pitrilysin family protein [Nanoarchaeota archaeon]